MEYTAQVSLKLINGEASLAISAVSFTASSPSGIAEVPYSESGAPGD